MGGGEIWILEWEEEKEKKKGVGKQVRALDIELEREEGGLTCMGKLSRGNGRGQEVRGRPGGIMGIGFEGSG